MGIKSNENKKNIFSLNTGITLIYPKAEYYNSRVKQQINPIINFEYSYAFLPNNYITTDLSFSQFNTYITTHSGNLYVDKPYLIIEIGYAHRFKKRTKEEKPTN